MQVEDIRVTIRVNRELKDNAEMLFHYLGLNMSSAVNIFLRMAVNQKGLPFAVQAEIPQSNDYMSVAEAQPHYAYQHYTYQPNDNLRCSGFGSDEVRAAFTHAVNQEIAQKQQKGLPIARFDTETKRAYLEYADGSKEYV
jgi:addiction module RelB/DinJ family antitoxin